MGHACCQKLCYGGAWLTRPPILKGRSTSVEQKTKSLGAIVTRKIFLLGMLAAGYFIATSVLMPSIGNAQADSRVVSSMASLKSKAEKLGAPKLKGKEEVGGKEAPALYLGSTKINNNFDLVDAVSKEDGKGMTATLFAKSGDEFIRVSTSVPKPDGSGRAIGTILDPAGKAIAEIKQGKPFYGEVTILGTPYITGYEPMKDEAGNIIGIYYVGYKK
jgi:Cache 3/Cache 2 fusion domain